MSAEEDLIDYSDEELATEAAPAAAADANGGAKKGDLTVSGGNADKKGSYVGIHSTGFRDFLLKPELLVPLRIAVSNILRRVSHNFHPQVPSLLKRVRPSRKQNKNLAYPSTSQRSILECLIAQDASLSSPCGERYTRKRKSRECSMVAAGERTIGGAERLPGSARIR